MPQKPKPVSNWRLTIHLGHTYLLCAEVAAAIILCKLSTEARKIMEIFELRKSLETRFPTEARSLPGYTADKSGTVPPKTMRRLSHRRKCRRKAMRARRDDRQQPLSMIFDRQQSSLPLPTISKTAFPRDHGIRLWIQGGKRGCMPPSKSFCRGKL
jgi:hypothetical protein